MKLKYLCSLSAAALLGMAVSSSAATITASGQGEVIATPAAMADDLHTNTLLQAYNEVSNFLLTDALAVDGGVIAAGTRIDSHMVFLNTLGNASGSAVATFTFGATVLATISDQNGTNLFASDYLGEAGGTDYSNIAGYNGLRGIESGDSVSFSGFDVDFDVRVREPGDWIRVITVAQVPVPAGLLLLPTGLIAMGAMRRKKRKAA